MKEINHVSIELLEIREMKTGARELLSFVAIAGIAGSVIGLLESMLWAQRGTVISADSVMILLVYASLGYGFCSMVFSVFWYLIVMRSQRFRCHFMWATSICIPIGLFVTLTAVTLINGGLLQYAVFVPASISLTIILCRLLSKFLERLPFLSSVQTWLLLQVMVLTANIFLIAILFETGGWQWFGVPAALLALGSSICFRFFKTFKNRVSILVLTNLIAIAILASIPIWPQVYGKKVMGQRQLPNVLLITIDTLRPDHLGCYGYESAQTPNIDQMADEGVLFLETVAPIPRTGPSHISILTGLYPFNHGVLKNGTRLSQKIVALPEILAEYGYHTAAFVSGWTLKNKSCGLASRFQTYDENFSPWPWLSEASFKIRLINLALMFGSKIGIENQKLERPAAQTTDAALRWLGRMRERPFFLWIHYFDPHFPYVSPVSYQKLQDPHCKGTLDLKWYSLNWYSLSASQRQKVVQDRKALDHMIALYDGEISYVDAQIGRLRKALKDWQLDSNTLIVLTSDHGESLDEHNVYFGHDDLYDTCLRVPLILNFPKHQRARQRISDQTRLIDVAPTILDFLNMDAHLPCEGRSLLPIITGKNTEEGVGAAFASLHDEKVMFCVRHKDFKLIRINRFLRDAHTMIPFREEIYNLRTDPSEIKNILAKSPVRLLEARRALEVWRDKKVDSQPTLSDEVKERLRSLGYIR